MVLLNQEKLNLYPPGSLKVNFLLWRAWCFISFIRRVLMLKKALASCSESLLLDIGVQASIKKFTERGNKC